MVGGSSHIRVALLICWLVAGRAGASSEVTPTVLAAPENMPQSYMVDGEQTGFLVDIVKEAFHRAGRSVEIRLMPWARCMAETRYGSIDGFFSAFMTPERLDDFSFSHQALMTPTESLFVRKGASITFDGDLSTLAEARIGLIYESSYGPRFEHFLAQRPPNPGERHGSLESVIRMLAGGRIDLFPGDRQTVMQTAASIGLSDMIVELSPAVETVPAYLAYTRRRDMAQIILEIDQSLKTMKEDGFYDMKLRQYYPQ